MKKDEVNVIHHDDDGTMVMVMVVFGNISFFR